MSAARDPQGRLPFDPQRVKGPPKQKGETSAGATTMLTVSAVSRMVKGAINQAFSGTLRVVGEVSNFTRSAGGHCYFTLKDSGAELRCVMWGSSTSSLKFEPTDGLEVVATGMVDVFEPRAQVQFYVRRLEPRGAGALDLAFRQLKEKLTREGLFDPKRKRPLPKYPRRIVVVTSITGAAVRDILQTLRRRFPAMEVLVYGVQVQGEGAAADIADAIRRINESRDRLGGVDVMIVGRGGGSLEDLWAFNEEIVARAIHASEIPVVSAVGHEVDFTIADFVADVRAATPTAAAELVVPVLSEVLDDLHEQERRLRRGAADAINQLRARLAVAMKSEWFRDPHGRVYQRQQQLDEIVGRLTLVLAKSIQLRHMRVHDAEIRLSRARPEAQLARRRENLERLRHRLNLAVLQSHRRTDRRMREAEVRLAGSSPFQRVIQDKRVLRESLIRIERGVARGFRDRAAVLASLEARLRAGSHEQILRRGFTITRRADDGRIVLSVADAPIGIILATQTTDGMIASRVEGTDKKSL